MSEITSSNIPDFERRLMSAAWRLFVLCVLVESFHADDPDGYLRKMLPLDKKEP